MTVHMFVLEPERLLHVSDRRLTYSTGGLFDPHSNKSLVVQGTDSIFAIGYAGAAFGVTKPIDVIVAEAITQRYFKPNVVISGFSPTKDADMTLAAIWDRVVARLKMEGARLGPRWAVDLLVAGYERRDTGAAPFSRAARLRGGTVLKQDNDVQVVEAKGQWRGSIGSGAPQLEALIRKWTVKHPPEASSWENLKAAVVRAARRTATLDRTVGPDVMMVEVALENEGPEVSVQYHPAREGLSVDLVHSLVPELLTPWIIGPRLAQAPAVIVGSMQSIGGIRVSCLSPPGSPPIEGPIVFGILPAPRRRWTFTPGSS